jgi:predicted enzyme related to lactoylglutathione lyase
VRSCGLWAETWPHSAAQALARRSSPLPAGAVPDLDTALAAVTAAGGEVVSPATDSPGFGRWAECRDDQGVRFGLRQPS